RILYMPGNGHSLVLDDARTVLRQMELTPPLVTLAKALEWSPLPLTIKEGRRFARQVSHRGEVGDAELDPSERVVPTLFDSSPVVQVQGLGFSYNGHPALDDVSLQVHQGEFVALMGRNGSGKTTLLKQLVGLLKPDQGQVQIAEPGDKPPLDTRRASVEQIIGTVGYVPQNPNALLFSDTVRQELDFTRQGHGQPLGDYKGLLDTLSLSAHAEHYPRDLSVGERQRVALAAILVAEPYVLLLDEPTRGLDYGQKAVLAAFLNQEKARGRTIIMATHDVELVAQCADRVVLLGEGQVVVDGPVRQVMSESLVFSSQITKLFRDPALLTVEDVLRAQEDLLRPQR
ncbi:MAG: energy-coupling factor ABC transporter ATP-binding protein, partial [Anaerolineae bacterium]